MGTRETDPAAEDIQSAAAWIAAPERDVVRVESALLRVNADLFDLASYASMAAAVGEELRQSYAEVRAALREGRAPDEAALDRVDALIADALTGTTRSWAFLAATRRHARRTFERHLRRPRPAWPPVALADLVARACLAVRSPLAPEPPVTIPDDVFVRVDPDAFVAVTRRLIEIRCVRHPAPDAPRKPVYLMADVSSGRVNVHIFRQLPASAEVGRGPARQEDEDEPARTQSHMLDWMVTDLGGYPREPHRGAPESSYAFSLPLAPR